jgi:hypothetical protein
MSTQSIPNTPITVNNLLAEALAPPEPDGLPALRTRWTATELLSTEFPEPRWAVPDLIPVGLTVLGGRPKVGKSWLALQIAHAVGTPDGGMVLGVKVEPGKVLYLALEDSPRRLKKRMEAQHVTTADIVFHTGWPYFSEGGLSDLQTEVTTGDYKLVVIDTFAKALGRGDQNDVSEMTVIIGTLQRMAQISNIAVLLIDHHRKVNGFETSPIDDILGSTAKAAIADGALGLYREQGKHGATLKVTGRDVEEKELALTWDVDYCCWQSLGDASEVRKDTLQADIITTIQALQEDGKTPTTARIAKFLKQRDSNVSAALGELLNAGKVRKGAKVGREVPYEHT